MVINDAAPQPVDMDGAFFGEDCRPFCFVIAQYEAFCAAGQSRLTGLMREVRLERSGQCQSFDDRRVIPAGDEPHQAAHAQGVFDKPGQFRAAARPAA